MGRWIKSKAQYTGRNYDVGPWRDDKYVRCSRCGFINNLDQAMHAQEGGYEGWGTTMTAISSTATGTGFGGTKQAPMQTPTPQGVVLFSSSFGATDILTNSFGSFSFTSSGQVLLNGSMTNLDGLSLLLLLYNSNIYTVCPLISLTDDSGHIIHDDSGNLILNGGWFIWSGSWVQINGDPRIGQSPVENIYDAVVAGGCAQCGTFLYDR